MQKFTFSLALALSVVGAACSQGTTSGNESTSSSSSTGGGTTSGTGNGSSRASSSGGTSGNSNGGQSGSHANNSSRTSASGTSGGTSSGGTGTAVLGGPCDATMGADNSACEALAQDAQCLGLMGAPVGLCGVPGCTAGMDGCAGAGTTCIGMGMNTVCVKSCQLQTGTGAPGAEGQCGPGGACVNFTTPACYPQATRECDADANTGCPMGSTCSPVGLDGYGQCAAGCDLFAQDCTGAMQACYPDGMGGALCAGTGGFMEGATCTHLNDCAAGMLCINEMAGGKCRKYCDMAHACTDAMRTCTSLGMGTNLSACTPAM